MGSKRLIFIYPLWGGRERRLDDADGYNGNKRCYKQEDGHARLPSKIFVSRSIIKLGKKLLQVKISKGLLGSKVPNERPLSRNWRKYCAQLSFNVDILTIFCMVSSDWTTRGSRDLLKNRTYQLTSNMIYFNSFYFIMQGKLVILGTRCFLHQNTSQLQWCKEKTILQSKFCCRLKSSISKSSIAKPRMHSVVTSREPKTTFPLNSFLMAVLNYSVVLASELYILLLINDAFWREAFCILVLYLFWRKHKL